MKVKIILSSITLIILILLYWINRYTEVGVEIEPGENFIVGYMASQATEIEVNWSQEKSSKKHKILLEKRTAGWMMVEPHLIKVDDKKVETKIENFLHLVSQEKVNLDRTPKLGNRLSNRYEIKFKNDEQEEVFTFIEKDLIEQLDHALVEFRGNDYLVEKWFLYGLKFLPGDLFKESLFSINPLNVIRVKTPDFTFEKEGVDWYFSGDVRDLKRELKQRILDKMVIDLVFLRGSSVVLQEDLREAILSQEKKKFEMELLSNNQIKQNLTLSFFLYEHRLYVLYNDLLYLTQEKNYSFLDYEKEELYK